MKTKLGSVLTIKHGYPFKGEFFSDEGEFIVLTPANFYEEGGFKYTPGKEKYYKSTFPTEYICKKNDLIVVMTQQAEGLLGSTAFIPEDGKFLHNQRIGLVKTDRKVLIPEYADYLFRTKSVREQIRNSASGTKVKHTSPEKIYDVEVDLPPIETQRKIANLLSSIDEKRNLNDSILLNIEGLAKELYNYWFVQFDFPNKNGKPYKLSGGKMIWNEKLNRDIPEGWVTGSLKDILHKETNTISVKNKGNLPYTPMDILPIRSMSFSETADQDDAKSSLIKYDKNAILFGAMRPYFHRVCIAPFDGITRTTVFTLYPINSDELGYAYETINQDYCVDYATAHHVGTQQPYAEWDSNLEDCPIALPPRNLRVEYSKRVKEIIDTVICLHLENSELTKLRNFLLPMLMNGQIKIGG